MPVDPPAPRTTQDRDVRRDLRVLRLLLLSILVFALIGTFVDLLLLDHYEDVWQTIPLILLALAAIALVWHAAVGGAASVRAIQALMLLFIVGGVTGGVLHFRASAAFHTDLNPRSGGWELVRTVLRSKAPPTLAPASLMQMGLLGLAYTYRHPALRRDAERGIQGEPT